jgi:hypothetical protein
VKIHKWDDVKLSGKLSAEKLQQIEKEAKEQADREIWIQVVTTLTRCKRDDLMLLQLALERSPRTLADMITRLLERHKNAPR